jgi:hypothetical protein
LPEKQGLGQKKALRCGKGAMQASEESIDSLFSNGIPRINNK